MFLELIPIRIRGNDANRTRSRSITVINMRQIQSHEFDIVKEVFGSTTPLIQVRQQGDKCRPT
jgi:hypothetical protein